MQLIGGFYYWVGYLGLLFGIFMFVCYVWAAGFQLLSPWIFKKFAPKFSPICRGRPQLLYLILAVAAATVTWLCYEQMFQRFSGFAVVDDQITLKYFWPKPDIVVARDRFTTFYLDMDRRGYRSGVVTLVFDGARYTSAVFDSSTIDTNKLDKILTDWRERTAGSGATSKTKS